MNLTYQLDYPPHIRFGWGARHQLPDILPHVTHDYTAYAAIVGNYQRRTGIVEELAQILDAQPAFVFSDISPDPNIGEVDAAVALLRHHPVSLVIAIGGGSVIDVAKAAAAIAPAGGTCHDYFTGARQLNRVGIPLVALPTTSGTGAEMTRNAVLTDPATQLKQSIRHPGMVPRAAIVDPELTITAPPEIIAASGLDALTQAVESYISTKATHTSRALAREAVGLIWHALPRACSIPGDRQPFIDMAEGSMLGALAFAHAGLGAVHGLAHPIGSLLHLKHGYTCAILLPHILRFNLPAAREPLDELAAWLHLPDGSAFIEATQELCSQLGIPHSFAGDGLAATHADFIVRNCRSNSMLTNPREMSDHEVRQLLATLSI